jgi:ribosomal protein S6--L-glutamate ligase
MQRLRRFTTEEEIILNQFDAIIPRIRPSITFYGCALTRQFEAFKSILFEPASNNTTQVDKLYSLQLLLHSGVGIPRPSAPP